MTKAPQTLHRRREGIGLTNVSANASNVFVKVVWNAFVTAIDESIGDIAIKE